MTSERGRLLLGALAALVLLFLFFRGMDWAALGQALAGARPLPLAGLVLVTVFLYGVRAWRWGGLLAPLARVGFMDLFSATMVGFASGLLIPRAGELLRPWLVSRRHPVPISAGFATIILERLIDLITVLGLFGLYLFVLPAPPQQVRGQLMDLVKLGGAITGAGAVVVLAFLLALHANAERVIGTIERLLARAPRWLRDPLSHVLRAFSDGLAVLRAPLPHLFVIGLQSLAIWLLIALGFHFNQIAFGIELPFRTTFLLIAFLVVGVAIPTPGMVGGFHAFYLLALSEVFGVPRPLAAAAGISAHALGNLPILVFGLALLGREGLSLGRVAEVTRAEDGKEGAPVKCPFCSHLEDKVVDSRESKEGDVIRRRRECLSCGKRFTSYERIDQIPHLVVKKDGRRERFDREKVMRGLLRSCQKRPVSVKTLEGIVDRVEAMVQESPDREVPTDQIGEFLMESLRELDKVAFVRFASVYRDFKDVDQFMGTLKGLLEAKD